MIGKMIFVLIVNSYSCYSAQQEKLPIHAKIKREVLGKTIKYSQQFSPQETLEATRTSHGNTENYEALNILCEPTQQGKSPEIRIIAVKKPDLIFLWFERFYKP